MVSELQKNLLTVLKKFDQICREHDIKYSLHGGTLLGAVREKGFIPWDDDIDITMMRSEYHKFLKCIPKENLNLLITHVGTIAKFVVAGVGYIDIIVYSYISSSKFLQKLKLLLLDILASLLKRKEEFEVIKPHKKHIILLLKVLSWIGNLFPYISRFNLYDKATLSFQGNRQFIHRATDQRCGRKLILPKEWMSEYVDMPFEDAYFMSTKDHHQVLVSAYGNDYMTPIRDIANEKLHEVARVFMQNQLAKR